MLSEEEKKWIGTCESLLDTGMMLLPGSSRWLINKVREFDKKIIELESHQNQPEEERCD